MSNDSTRAALAERRNGNAYQNGSQQSGQQGGQQNGQRRYQNRSAPPVPTEPVIPPLDDRAPTGAVSWPFVLVEGGEKTGKSWQMALLSASDRVSRSWWLDLSEGGADEYGAIPGVRYRVLNHDGSWRSIMGQVRAVRQEAANARERGDKPVCLFIDSGTLIWTGLAQWAEQLARRSPTGQAALRANPNADVTITVTHWNAANKRWRELMTLLLTFPGIVVMSARGKYVTEIGDDGKPVKNAEKVYKVEGQKDLAFDATVWVRMLRDGSVEIVGARSVHAGIRPGGDQPEKIRKGHFSLDWLIFDALRCDPDRAHVRDLKDLDGDRGEAHEDSERDKQLAARHAERVDPAARRVDRPAPPAARADDANPGGEFDQEDRGEDDAVAFAQFAEEVVNDGTTRAAIKALWEEARNNGWLGNQLPGRDDTVRDLLTSRSDTIKAGGA